MSGSVFLGRHIVLTLGDLPVKPYSAVPDGIELALFQGWYTGRGLLQKLLPCLFRFTQTLEQLPGKMGHGRVSASFGNDAAGIRQGQVGEGLLVIRVIQIQAFIQRDGTFMELYLRVPGAVKEAGCIQRLRVEIRENAVDLLFQILIGFRIGHLINQEKAMEPGPGALALLGQVVVTAEVEADRDVREQAENLLRGNPLLRVLAVPVITIQRQAVGANEVLVGTIALGVFNRHIILAHGLPERFLISGADLVRIKAVPLVANTVGPIKIESCHSDQASISDWVSSTDSIQRSASFMVSSSASPPRMISMESQPN